MERYQDLSGTSGIESYEVGDDWIKVRFRGGYAYTYNHASAGVDHVERMKALARAGRGLGTYIGRNVRDAYAAKEP